MASLKLRYLIALVLLSAAACLVKSLQYDSKQDDVAGLAAIRTIPMRLGKWQGHDVPLAEEVYDILETRAILNRKYVSPEGNYIFLSIVHYSDTKVDFHAPEACLGGRGERTTKIVKKIYLTLNGKTFPLTIAEVKAKNFDSQSLSYYFYKAGNFMGQSYIKMRLNIAYNRLTEQNKSGSLIRVSVPMQLTVSKEKQEAQLVQFLQELVPFLVNHDKNI
ncbi:hypothetical protein MNBD_DELTA04-1624 [hydrothermal vent metagenome]|uniref:Methanolan biosynthesis EpsI domain-containing protein n=1 Tax=hydrothermal vent metagenome TaxID=652676 RepID=A0A3B0VTG7_9ZZZZ